MPKAGMFAGEVTTSAPADGAATVKQKGYHWLEHGDVVVPFVPSTTTTSDAGGVAATQSNHHAGSPNLLHPFEGESYDEFTMSIVGQITSNPSLGADTWSHAFNLHEFGENTVIGAFRHSGTGQLRFYHDVDSFGEIGSVSNGDINVTSTINDWYWIGFSYKKSTSSRHFHAVNLDTGTELFTSSFGGSDFSIKWDPSGDTKDTSVCNWGFQNWNVGKTFATWKGYLSQILIHNKYIDLSVAGNRRLFCALDGAIDYGSLGEIPLGERPLVYCHNGHPSSNVGTKFIGSWPSDFWINPAAVFDEHLPPIGTP